MLSPLLVDEGRAGHVPDVGGPVHPGVWVVPVIHAVHAVVHAGVKGPGDRALREVNFRVLLCVVGHKQVLLEKIGFTYTFNVHTQLCRVMLLSIIIVPGKHKYPTSKH